MADGEMKRVNEALGRLQSLDRRLRELDSVIESVPGRRAAGEGRLASARQALDAARGSAENDALTRRRLEREIAQIEGERAKYQTQQISVKTNKEYDALRAEISRAGERISAAEDDVLALLEKESEHERTVAEGTAALQDDEARAAQELAALEAERASAEADRAELQSTRQAAVEDVGPATMSIYQRIGATRDGLAVVQVSNESCGGCYSAVPPQKVAEVRGASKIVHCEYCGRILVHEPT